MWTSRSCESFSEELAELGFAVCANPVDRLLRSELGLSRRKMEKTLALGENADRDAQFQRMNRVQQYFRGRGWPVLSIDTKKKELLGRFERTGRAWTNDRLQAWDHDFPSSSWGKVIPYGVYDLAANEALVYLAQGADTGELACDAIRRWWHRLGKWRYDAASPILLLADCGGSNGYRLPLFRQQLHQLSQLSGPHLPRLPSSALLLEVQSHRPSPVLPPVPCLAGNSTHQHRSHLPGPPTNHDADWLTRGLRTGPQGLRGWPQSRS